MKEKKHNHKKHNHENHIHEEQIQVRKKSMTMITLKRLSESKTAMIGLGIIILIFLVSLIGPFFCKYGVNEMIMADRCLPPSAKHWFGTDTYGRDIFVRLLYGGRYSLILGISGSLFGLAIGVVLGLINGYIGGAFDNIFMRILDIWSAIPGTLLAVLISTVLGPGFFNTMVALSIGSVPLIIRLLRGRILSVGHEEFLEAATTINASPFRIMFKHMLPNVISPVIVNTTMSVGGVILEAAALSYIGLGIQPPNPEWGAMLSDAKNYATYYPWMLLFPGCAIALVVLCINLLGDGLRDAIDPKLKK
ncbi:MAG: ABC transporter permease [Lachnospiraceae bacterium]|jgi:ABC-type dipeptide/oligopeptide/nickel transport system permease subunit|nr:ABC transporter permease [Lachnospiraceae bacterium]